LASARKQARLDSNQDNQYQKLVCYRYTTGLSQADARSFCRSRDTLEGRRKRDAAGWERMSGTGCQLERITQPVGFVIAPVHAALCFAKPEPLRQAEGLMVG